MRLLTDVQVIHHDDPAYGHREFHGGEGRIVGSTRHTNGFNTWGGDHGTLGHLTCYNSMLLAYYLTGDLRWREVVVGEWQRTLLDDRLNPQYDVADRTRSRHGDLASVATREGSRDVSNALGELLDLYQLTYEPRILALVEPLLESFLEQYMRQWGQALQNVLQFTGSQRARDQLLAGVEEHRRARLEGRTPEDPTAVWYTLAPHDILATAAIVDPSSGAHVDAWVAADLPTHVVKSRLMLEQVPGSVIFCQIPDWVLAMPRTMFAMDAAGAGSRRASWAAPQAMPIDDVGNGRWLRCVIRKDRPGPFDVTISGEVGPPGVPVRIFGPDGGLLVDHVVPAGRHDGHAIRVADERAGEFTAMIKGRDAEDRLLVPLTPFPEVYCTSYWSQHAPTRFFTRSAGDEPRAVSIKPHALAGAIQANDGRIVASTDAGETLAAEAGPEGLWIVARSKYVQVPGSQLVLAVDPDRWFAPGATALGIKP
jgi:hypothetical protein